MSDGVVAGTIALKNIGNNCGALRKMFVKSEFRGADKGIASGLLSVLEDGAREMDTGMYTWAQPPFQSSTQFLQEKQDLLKF
jgi:N-acetylglutamate synthase-like GNAT family acetyltransferase